MADLVVLDLDSDPRERGRTHGRTMRNQIRENYLTYVDRFQAGGAKLPGGPGTERRLGRRSLLAIIPNIPKRCSA